MVYEIEQTAQFQTWHTAMRDLKGRVAIARRLERASVGLLGDVRPVGGDVSEMRVDVGPGYRIYFTARGSRLIVVLVGGDKSSQPRDIKRAIEIAKEF